MSELAEICDSVTIIDRGDVKYSGTLKDLVSENKEEVKYDLVLAVDHLPAIAHLEKQEGIIEVEKIEDEEAEYHMLFNKNRIDTNAILRVFPRRCATFTWR